MASIVACGVAREMIASVSVVFLAVGHKQV